ncbi:MAG: hypothetical protein GX547_16205 [Phycisphaerae bacterium]|nr:hypothetical protein [Phycisphaerae bacterium]
MKPAAILAAALHRAAGEPITYRRGEALVSLTAVRGQSEFDPLDPAGVAITSHTTDWLVQRADLAADGELLTPAAGDTIEDAAGVRYDVRRPDGEKPYRYSDHAATRLRIHSQRR